jgi:hypothetical protein
MSMGRAKHVLNHEDLTALTAPADCSANSFAADQGAETLNSRGVVLPPVPANALPNQTSKVSPAVAPALLNDLSPSNDYVTSANPSPLRTLLGVSSYVATGAVAGLLAGALAWEVVSAFTQAATYPGGISELFSEGGIRSFVSEARAYFAELGLVPRSGEIFTVEGPAKQPVPLVSQPTLNSQIEALSSAFNWRPLVIGVAIMIGAVCGLLGGTRRYSSQ